MMTLIVLSSVRFVCPWLHFKLSLFARLCAKGTCQKLAFRVVWPAGVDFTATSILTVNRFARPPFYLLRQSRPFPGKKKTKKQTRFTQSAKSTPTFPSLTPNGDKLCMFEREKETQSIIQNQYSLWVCAQGDGERRAAAPPRWSKALHASWRLASVFHRAADQQKLLEFGEKARKTAAGALWHWGATTRSESAEACEVILITDAEVGRCIRSERRRGDEGDTWLILMPRHDGIIRQLVEDADDSRR